MPSCSEHLAISLVDTLSFHTLINSSLAINHSVEGNSPGIEYKWCLIGVSSYILKLMKNGCEEFYRGAINVIKKLRYGNHTQCEIN